MISSELSLRRRNGEILHQDFLKVIFHLKKYFCVLKTWFVCETQNTLDCILYPTTQCTQLHSFFHYEEWHGFIAGQPAWCHLILFWNRELSRWQDFSSLSSSLWCVSWVVQLQTDVTILIQILKLHQRHSYGILRLQSNSLSILPKPTQNMMQGTMPIWQYAPPHYLLFPQSVLNSSSSLIYSCVGHGISGFDSNLKFNIQAKQLKNQFLFLWVRAQTCRSHPASE